MFKKLVIAILIGLLSYPPFAFAGGAFDSKTFPGLEPDTYADCFFYFNQGDARMYGDGSFMTDGSGGGNHLEQGIGAKEFIENATYLHADGTDDFAQQEVIASWTGLTSADIRCSFHATASWLAWDALDFSAYNSADYEVILTDATGKRKKGVLSATVGGGEAFTEKVVNGDNETAMASLDAEDNAVRCTAAQSADRGYDSSSNSMKLIQAHSGDGWFAYALEDSNLSTLDAGKSYLISTQHYDLGTNSGNAIRLRAYYNSGADYIADATGQTTQDAWVEQGMNVVIDDSFKLYLYSYSSAYAIGDVTYWDNISIKERTDCDSNGVHCTWGTEEALFNVNAITGIEIRKAAYSVTGDLSGFAVLRLDDGIPATTYMLMSKWEAAGTYSYAIEVLTSGKLRGALSADGTTNILIDSDAAPFPNNQTGWYLVGWSYKTSTSFTFYVNGSAVASTPTGGIPAALFDTCARFEMGSYNKGTGLFLAGDVAASGLFARYLTAAEQMNIYNSDTIKEIMGR